jgi:hypothetical protein
VPPRVRLRLWPAVLPSRLVGLRADDAVAPRRAADRAGPSIEGARTYAGATPTGAVGRFARVGSSAASRHHQCSSSFWPRPLRLWFLFGDVLRRQRHQVPKVFAQRGFGSARRQAKSPPICRARARERRRWFGSGHPILFLPQLPLEKYEELGEADLSQPSPDLDLAGGGVATYPNILASKAYCWGRAFRRDIGGVARAARRPHGWRTL